MRVTYKKKKPTNSPLFTGHLQEVELFSLQNEKKNILTLHHIFRFQ